MLILSKERHRRLGGAYMHCYITASQMQVKWVTLNPQREETPSCDCPWIWVTEWYAKWPKIPTCQQVTTLEDCILLIEIGLITLWMNIFHWKTVCYWFRQTKWIIKIAINTKCSCSNVFLFYFILWWINCHPTELSSSEISSNDLYYREKGKVQWTFQSPNLNKWTIGTPIISQWKDLEKPELGFWWEDSEEEML